jgi:hypothetical protein
MIHQILPKSQQEKWKPHPKQADALERTEFEVLYGGARGGGKTDAGIAWLTRHINNPRFRALVIRRNADDLSDWVSRARGMYEGIDAQIAYRPPIITFPSGAVIRTGHLKDDNAYGKYLGHEYQRMVIEELNQIPTEELYLKLISSCRSIIPEIKPQVFATTNPGGIGHAWVKKRFVDVAIPGERFVDPETGRDRIFIPAKVRDNPTLMKHNPEYLKFLDGLPDQLRKAWRDGNWDIVAGQVFTEWNAQLHVIKPFSIPQQWNKWIALDWGVNEPSAVGWYAQNEDGRTFLYRELYMNGTDFHKAFGVPLTPKRLSTIIQELGKDDGGYIICFADPSLWNKIISGEGGKGVQNEGESIAETMIKSGLRMKKADNDRINGLARYREALSMAPDGKPWYQVFETCQDTIRTIPALPYDLRKVEDVDTDAEDHAYDRDRYFFMGRPSKTELVKKEEVSKLQLKYRALTERLKEGALNVPDQYEREWEES